MNILILPNNTTVLNCYISFCNKLMELGKIKDYIIGRAKRSIIVSSVFYYKDLD